MNIKCILDISEILISSISSCWLLSEYYKIFFVQERKSIIYWGLYFIWQCIVYTNVIIPWYLILTLNIAFITLLGIFLYQGELSRKFIFSISLCALWMLAEFFVGYLFLIYEINRNEAKFLGAIISKLLLMIFIVLLPLVAKRNIRNNIESRYNVLLCLVPLGSILIMSDIFYLTNLAYTKVNIYFEIIVAIVCLYINILIFRLYSRLANTMHLEKINAIYEQQINNYNKYIKEKEAEVEKNRNIRHDLKQHLVYLKSMMEKDNNVEGLNYINKLYKLSETKSYISTDNFVVDAIVNNKYEVALENNIQMFSSINIPVELNFEDTDICLILGNLLDNAIEANSLVNRDKRKISLTIRFDAGNLYIKIKNPFKGNIEKNRYGRFNTTKKCKGHHGIGLLSVKKAVEKYNGELKIDYKDDFEVIVLLYSEANLSLN